ncbi:CD164 sialomucin-like 2 protein isoform X1 [Lepisosteus oculatus]|uniref:CD164 sialomucin-like 2 protein isoform X1 n=2 Tax=Lepisosteus oculatus TaxID=7918 RepID=UPI00074020FC|nr:PREDICTED: CD164 sialomucin-like 2 protein isoform X3 [Lepisosteus oculatus]
MSCFRAAVGAAFVLTVVQTCCCQTAGDCSQLMSCTDCISGDSSMNITGCVWRQCDNGNDTGCVASSEESQGCSLYNDTAMCIAPGSTVPSSSTDGPSPTEPVPVYKQANFDLSSFIGGIILVLGAQAGIFFIMKFVKSRDSTYETLLASLTTTRIQSMR